MGEEVDPKIEYPKKVRRMDPEGSKDIEEGEEEEEVDPQRDE
jgi:hypothetical protein